MEMFRPNLNTGVWSQNRHEELCFLVALSDAAVMSAEGDFLPAYLRYVKDLATSVDCCTMTTEEYGAYTLLLDCSWGSNPQCFLPNDEDLLRKITRLSRGKFKKFWKKFSAKFSQRDKFIFNSRLLSEYEKVHKSHNGRVLAGMKGAEARWHSYSNANSKALAFDGIQSNPIQEELRLRGGVGGASAIECVLDAKSVIGSRTRTKPRKPELHEHAQEVAEAYREIRGDGIAAGVKNVSTWLREGIPKADLQAAIENYRPVAMERDPQYRKRLGNFFGREAPEFKDWITGPPASAAQEDSTDKAIRISTEKWQAEEVRKRNGGRS